MLNMKHNLGTVFLLVPALGKAERWLPLFGPSEVTLSL